MTNSTRKYPGSILLPLSVLTLLGACSDTNVPAAHPTTTAAPVAAPAKVDPNAIDAPIPAGAFKATVALSGQPVFSPEKSTFVFQVLVKNQGTAALYGAGKYPVTLAVEILGSSGSPDRDGGVRDFIRVALPLIPPGQMATVVANIPVDSVRGHKLRFALVQEFVAWHEEADAIFETDPNSIKP